MKQIVPYLDLAAQMRPLRREIETAIGQVLDECSFCLGPHVEQFERHFAEYCQAQYAIGFNSGTSALHVAARLLNLQPGDEVITTPFTFIATSWAVVYTGATPVYVDIDAQHFTLDPAKVEAAITPRTKAIFPVHLFGHPCDLDPLLEICHKHHLALVEDAAQAHGARYKGRPVGAIGDLGAFSFYPSKNLGACGEAGALATNSEALAKRARSLRNHGSPVSYVHEEVGYNYRMEGLHGAILDVKLKHLAAWNAARRRVAQRYHELLKGTELGLPSEAPWAEPVYHLYLVRHPRRDALKKHLESHGIGCRLIYQTPLHLQKCFGGLKYKAGDLPIAEKTAREGLALPMYPEMTDAQIQTVAGAIREFLG
jgi:dTDP-4-amino-4,6-dideoxygalactose transaminase